MLSYFLEGTGGSAYASISRPSAFENTFKPGAIKNIINNIKEFLLSENVKIYIFSGN